MRPIKNPIKLRPKDDGRWLVTWRFAGQQSRKTFDTKGEAEAHVNVIATAQEAAVPTALINNQRLLDLVSICWRRFGEDGFVEMMGEKLRRCPEAPPLQEGINHYLDMLRAKGCCEQHIQNTGLHLCKLQPLHLNKPASEITQVLIETVLYSIDNPKTRKNTRISFVSFFNWMKRKGWLPETLWTVAERTEVPKVEVRQPEIFTPDEMRRLMTVPDGPVKLYLVLGGFCGVRSAEIARLRWQNWDSPAQVLVLPSEITKTSRRRIVNLEPNANAWIDKLCPYRTPPETPIIQFDEQRVRAILNRHCKKVGVVWKQNALRHSYASYHLELYGDAVRTSKNLGNSPSVLETEYLQLTNRASAQEWFSILP